MRGSSSQIAGSVAHRGSSANRADRVRLTSSSDVAIDGGDNTDILFGGSGDDTFTGGTGGDTFVFGMGHRSDRITDSTRTKTPPPGYDHLLPALQGQSPAAVPFGATTRPFSTSHTPSASHRLLASAVTPLPATTGSTGATRRPRMPARRTVRSRSPSPTPQVPTLQRPDVVSMRLRRFGKLVDARYRAASRASTRLPIAPVPALR